MSKIYDDWERLVAAVLKKEQIRELCLQDSTSPSKGSMSSDSSFTLSILSDFSFTPVSHASTSRYSPSSHQLKHHNSPEYGIVESRSRNVHGEMSWYAGRTEKVVATKRNFPYQVEDLLRAPALPLGIGTFGGTYKVILDEKTVVVVKRVNGRREEFQRQIRVLASMSHENIVPTVAYFNFMRNEYQTCLLLYDYCRRSVRQMLHDKIGKRVEPLDWNTCVRIGIGTARGLAYIHEKNLVHGNVKASNIFLNSHQYGCVSEHCLVPLNDSHEPFRIQNVEYHAPEAIKYRRISQASDVYSFGIFLLELLTRKSPLNANFGNRGVGMVQWVYSVASEKGMSKAFDKELVNDREAEEEMMKMLLMGMHCVAGKPEKRPKMCDVLKMIECWDQM